MVFKQGRVAASSTRIMSCVRARCSLGGGDYLSSKKRVAPEGAYDGLAQPPVWSDSRITAAGLITTATGMNKAYVRSI
jgi:hypothetical protein